MITETQIEEARKRRDDYRDYIETLPAYIYNSDPDKYQALLESLDQELDRLLDEKNNVHPAEVAYQMDDGEYPLTFSGGEVDEIRPYKPHTLIVEDDLPY